MGNGTVSLRGGRGPPHAAKPMVAFRCPPEIRAYIKRAAEAPNRDQTEVISSALALDRDLAEKLATERGRLMAFAASHELEMHKDLAEILSRLVRRGLESYERERKSKK